MGGANIFVPYEPPRGVFIGLSYWDVKTSSANQDLSYHSPYTDSFTDKNLRRCLHVGLGKQFDKTSKAEPARR